MRAAGNGTRHEIALNKGRSHHPITMLTTLELGFMAAGGAVLIVGAPHLARRLSLQMSASLEDKLVGAIAAIYFCTCIAVFLTD